MQTRYWTRPGILRLEEQVKELEEKVHQFGLDRTEFGPITSFERQSDRAAVYGEEAQYADRLKQLSHLRSEIAEVPVFHQTKTVQTGSKVEIRYLDDDHRFIFVMGGCGESDQSSRIPTVSCDCALGRALIGREAGDETEIRPPGKVYWVRITKISIPKEVKAKSAAV